MQLYHCKILIVRDFYSHGRINYMASSILTNSFMPDHCINLMLLMSNKPEVVKSVQSSC